MNPWQLAQQLKHELQQVTWPVTGGEAVFGTHAGVVAVFAGAPDESNFPKVFPCCLIVMDSGTPDDDHPDLIEQTFRLVTGAMSSGDDQGEFAIIGGPSSDLTSSANRGIGEVQERVLSAVENLTGADGARILVTASAIDTPFHVGSLRHVVFDACTLTATCTRALDFVAPQVMRNTTGSTFSWAGAHCTSRFDFVQFRVFKSAGVITSPDDASATLMATTTSTTAALASATAGQYYTVFADYNSRGGSTVENSSSGVVGSYVRKL